MRFVGKKSGPSPALSTTHLITREKRNDEALSPNRVGSPSAMELRSARTRASEIGYWQALADPSRSSRSRV